MDMVNRRTPAFWQAYSVFTHRDRAEVGWRSCNIGHTVGAVAPRQIDTRSEHDILASRKTHSSVFHFLRYSPSRSPYFRSYLTAFFISPLVSPQALSRLSDLRFHAFQFTSSLRLSLTSLRLHQRTRRVYHTATMDTLQRTGRLSSSSSCFVQEWDSPLPCSQQSRSCVATMSSTRS